MRDEIQLYRQGLRRRERREALKRHLIHCAGILALAIILTGLIQFALLLIGGE